MFDYHNGILYRCGIDVMEITPVQEYVLHMRNDQMSGSKPGNTEKAFSR